VSLKIVWEFARAWPLHILTALLFAAVLVIAPQQGGLIVYKGSLVFGGAIGAYWVNRIMFKRPTDDGEHTIHDKIPGPTIHQDWQLCAMVCAAMLAASLAA
jgi:hypothetical protein